MSGAEAVLIISRNGHTVDIDGVTLVVRPRMSAALRDFALQWRGEIVAFLRDLEATPATAHEFVSTALVAENAARRDLACCIACGVTIELHGMPPSIAWRLVQDVNSVVLTRASAIVVGEIARLFVEKPNTIGAPDMPQGNASHHATRSE